MTSGNGTMRPVNGEATRQGSAERPPVVWVVDDEESVRESLRWLGNSVGLGVEAYGTAEEFLAGYDSSRAGSLVLDVRIPGMSGLELQRELIARRITLPILMITGYADVKTAVHALTGGAFDFVEKPFSRQLLLDRIRQAIVVDETARRSEAERAGVRVRVATLTPREREVLDLVVAGQTNKAIAFDLRVSAKTVEVHRAHCMRKMKVESLAELVRLMSLLGDERVPRNGDAPALLRESAGR